MALRLREQKFEEIRCLLEQHYPTLHLADENGRWFIRGSFPVRADGKAIDYYLVEILVPQGFPREVPLVKELGGRIEKHPDWHVNKNGELCLFLSLERWKHLPDSATIITFLDGPLNDFFFGQAFVERYGRWPSGERGHGVAGIREYLAEELGTDDVATMKRFLEYLSKDRPKGHWDCFCGSGEKMRHCHFDKVIDLRGKIRPPEARYALWLLNQRGNAQRKMVDM